MRDIFDRVLRRQGPNLPPGTTSEEIVLHRAEGEVSLTRHSLPLDAVAPDPYWATLFRNRTRHGVVALVVPASYRDSGHLYWSTHTNIPHRLYGNSQNLRPSVILASTWDADPETGELQRTVSITADSGVESSAVDAGKLASILSESGVDGDVNLVISSVHENSPTGASQAHFEGTFDRFRSQSTSTER